MHAATLIITQLFSKIQDNWIGKIEQFQEYIKEQNILYLFQKYFHTSRSLAMYASTLQACAASYAWIGSAISTNLTLFYTDWNAQQGNKKVCFCAHMFSDVLFWDQFTIFDDFWYRGSSYLQVCCNSLNIANLRSMSHWCQQPGFHKPFPL